MQNTDYSILECQRSTTYIICTDEHLCTLCQDSTQTHMCSGTILSCSRAQRGISQLTGNRSTVMFNLEKNLTVQSFLCHTEMLGHVSHVHLSGRGKCGNCKVKIQFSYESCYLFAKPVRSDWVVWVFVSCVMMEYDNGICGRRNFQTIFT